MTPQKTDKLLDRHWLAALRARACQPPGRPRVPLWSVLGSMAPVQLGTVEPDFFERIPLNALPVFNSLLRKEEHFGLTGWVLLGPVSAGLDHLAQAMRTAGLAGAWRDEQLAVCGPHGERLGTV